jgi:phage terminase small subunit
MSRQEALEKLSNLARTDLKDLVEFGSYDLGEDQDGNPIVQASWRIKDSVMQDPNKMAAISELTAGRDGIKIKTHSPITAIQQLAKMQGWEAATKHELTGKDGAPLNPTKIELVAPTLIAKTDEDDGK